MTPREAEVERLLAPAENQTQPHCEYCRARIDGEPIIKYRRADAAPIPFHSGCWEIVAREQERRERAERQREEQRLRCISDHTRGALETLPRGYQHAIVGTPEFTAAVKSPKLRSLAEKWTWEHGGRLILGPSDAGKSTSVVALLRRLIAEATEPGAVWHQGRGVDSLVPQREWFAGWRPTPELTRAGGIVWTTATRIVHARKSHPLGQGDPPLVTQCIEATLLVVDEMGFEGPDPGGDLLYIVSERYDGGRVPTIITSGLDAAGFERLYGTGVTRKWGQLLEVS